MEKIGCFIGLVSLLLFSTSGCENVDPKITEEQAKSIVIENHTDNQGKVEIISVTYKKNEYIIVWEKIANCENGIDYIDDQSGEVKRAETTIC